MESTIPTTRGHLVVEAFTCKPEESTCRPAHEMEMVARHSGPSVRGGTCGTMCPVCPDCLACLGAHCSLINN